MMYLQGKITQKLWISLLVLGLGGITSIAADYGISKLFPERVILKDVMFLIVPYMPSLAVLADAVVAIAFVGILILSRFKQEKLAQLFFSVGILYTIRAMLNFVTPIGDPSGDLTTYGFLEFKPMLGMFPSGHIAILNAEFWLARLWKAPKSAEYFFIILMIVESLALWATRGHYTIDIAGGIVLGYLAVKIMKVYLQTGSVVPTDIK